MVRLRRPKSCARPRRYRTYSHTDAGPREYQTVGTTLEHGQSLVRAAREIVEGFDCTAVHAPLLEQKIKQLIAIEVDGTQKGNSSRLAGEIVQMSRDIYQKNFPGGVDLRRFRLWMVAVYLLAGSLAGAGAGAGADYAGRYLRSQRSQQLP
jgi:hypothetical protein